MEIPGFCKKGIGIYHLPTFLLVIGYPVYWLELYFFHDRAGVTSPLAVLLTGLAVIVMGLLSRPAALNYSLRYEKTFSGKILVITAGLLVFGLLSVAFYAALFPPHLAQEYDCLNYHYSIPRQHLILGSFAHIPWSSADLFPLPIQFALAPFWFITELPNKFPQFLFLLGLMTAAANLVRKLSPQPISILLLIAAILGSHNIGIQMGTGMLDAAICYLFIAALDSFLEDEIGLAAIEFTFFFWAKSFVPPQMIFIGLVIAALIIAVKKLGFKSFKIDFTATLVDIGLKRTKKFVVYFLFLSVFVGGPFVAKSLYYSGTPLYPLAAGKLVVNPRLDQNSVAWKSLLNAAQDHVGTRNAYGYGRSFGAFIKHLWLVAVPEKGVNNRFDYPLGLPYLLFIVPFIAHLAESVRKKQFTLLPWFVVVYWLSWWMGSQQTRFLYIPLVLIFVNILAAQKFSSRALFAMLVLAMGLNLISVTRAHRHDFGLNREAVLRKNDLQIMEMSGQYLHDKKTGFVPLDTQEVAFAQFPAMVAPEHLPYVLAVNPQ
jgi:hypothetical protein